MKFPLLLLKRTNYSLFLFFLFFVLIFFDAINGYLVVANIIPESGIGSPSQIGRFLILLYVFSILYIKRINLLPFFVFTFLLILIEFVNALTHINSYGVQYGVINVYKLLYIYGFFLVLSYYLKDVEAFKLLAKYYFINVFIVSFFIYFSSITGVGNSTYGPNTFGTKSFFSSGNGLGLYLGVSILLIQAFKAHSLLNISNRLLLLLIFSVPLIGTKTALIFFIINIVLFFWLSVYRNYFLFFSVLLTFAVLPNIVDALSIMFDVIIYRYQKSDNIITYLGSGRIEYVISAFDVFLNQNPSVFRFLFGAGAFISFQSYKGTNSFDTLETDLFDIFFMYGALGATVYLVVIVYLLYKLRLHGVLFLCALLISFHSLIAGHVMFNGMSSVPFAVLIALSTKIKNIRRIS